MSGLVRVMKKSQTRGEGREWSGDTVLGRLFRETLGSPRSDTVTVLKEMREGRTGIWGEGTPKAEVLGTCKQARRDAKEAGAVSGDGEWQDEGRAPGLLGLSS